MSNFTMNYFGQVGFLLTISGLAIRGGTRYCYRLKWYLVPPDFKEYSILYMYMCIYILYIVPVGSISTMLCSKSASYKEVIIAMSKEQYCHLIKSDLTVTSLS